MPALFASLRQALRDLRGSPVVALAAILSIGIVLGTSAVVFTWLDGIVYAPLRGIPEQDRLHVLSRQVGDEPVRGMPGVSFPMFRELRAAQDAPGAVALYRPLRLALRLGREDYSTPLWAVLTSGEYFDVLGVPAALGRTLDANDEHAAAPVAVIGHSMWQSTFGGRADAIGRELWLNGVAVTIVGVAPPQFHGTVVGLGYQLWLPVTLQDRLVPGAHDLGDGSDRWWQLLTRVAPGMDASTAVARWSELGHRISAAQGEQPVASLALRRIRDTQLGSLVAPLGTALLATMALVFLAGTANVACLLLARAIARQRDTAVRMALGANRGRVVHQSLMHSVLIAIGAAAVALLIAAVGKDSLWWMLPGSSAFPWALDLRISARTVVFVATAGALAIGLFGVLPALASSRAGATSALRGAAQGMSRSRVRQFRALMAAQVAFALVALVCGGLFLRSVERLSNQDFGFAQPERLLLVTSDLNAIPAARRAALVQDLERASLGLPGVRAAALASMLPMSFGGHRLEPLTIEGQSLDAQRNHEAEVVSVTDGYFETLGLHSASGRTFDTRDDATHPLGVVVNQAFARQYWPDADPIGRRIDLGRGWATIIGVVSDASFRDIGDPPGPTAFFSLRQLEAANLALFVRTTDDPLALVPALRSEFRRIEPDLPFLDPKTLDEQTWAAMFAQRVAAAVLAVLGTIALVLAAIGIYAVAAFWVVQRRREIAIGVALGATPGRTFGKVLAQSAGPVLVGLALGYPIALGIAALARDKLLGVSIIDLPTLAISGALLIAATLGAAARPAATAARTAPTEALRST